MSNMREQIGKNITLFCYSLISFSYCFELNIGHGNGG